MLLLEKYEDTTLYDASLAVDLAETLSQDENVEADVNPEDVMNEGLDHSTNELIIIDSAVGDYEAFITDNPGVDHYVIEEGESISDIASKISSFSNLSAIHIISHGNQGGILIGGELIDSDSASENLSLFESIKGSLNDDGDLLLYGCNVSEGSGRDFVSLVAQLTDADVKASDDLTGNESVGGDWELEVEEGEVESEEIEFSDFEDDLGTFNIQPGQSQLARHKLSRDTDNNDSFQSASFSFNPPPGRTLSHRIIPPSGSENRPDNVSYTYVADPTYEGRVTVTTRWKMEGGGRGGQTTFENRTDTFIIAFPNARPTGQDQEVSGTEDTPLTFQESDFSTGFNDADADDVFERIRIDSLPSGSLELSGVAVSVGDIISAADIANLEYQGVQDAFGNDVDSFQFSVGDDQAFSNSSNTMTIDLAGVNDPPILRVGSPAETGVAGANETTPEDTPLILTLNDYVLDVDGDALSLNGSGLATNGSITDNGDGTITFSPDANFFGSDSLVLTVTDGEFDVVITIPVEVTPVNDAPTSQDQSVTATEDEDFTFQESNFSVGYFDVEGEALSSIRIDSLPNGTFELDGATVNIGDEIAVGDINKLVYRAPLNENGNDFTSFDFSVSDGIDFSDSSFTMTIDVNSVNDAPILRVGSPAETGVAGANETTAEDNALTLTLSDYVLDVDGDLLTLDGPGAATNGTVSDNGDGTITFTPDANFFGSDSVVVTVTDGEFDVAITIPVEVTPVNDAPTSQDQSVTATEDEDFTFQESNFSVGYFDVEGEALSSIRIDSLPNGTFELDGATVNIGDEIAVGDINKLVYRAPLNENGNDFTSFDFSVSDGIDFSDSSFTMTIDVNSVNDAPILRVGSPAETGVAGANETTAEDNALTLTLSDYVLDVDGDLLTLDGPGAATNGTVSDNGDGTITFTPDANFFGSDSVVVTVTDGEFDVAITIPVEVTPVNDAPTSQDQSVTATEDEDFTFQESNFSVGYFDVEGEALSSIRIDSLPNGTFELDGATVNIGDEIAVGDINKLVYRAPLNENGNDFTSFDFSVSDGIDFSDSSFTMTIDVNSVNDAPILRVGSPAETGVAGANETTPEDTPLILTLNDYVLDVDGDALSLNGSGLATNGSITDNGDGTITFSPDANFFGSDSLVLTVTDGEFDVVITIPVEVTPVNDAPVAVNDFTETDSNTPVLVNVLANDTDIEGDPLTITRIVSTPDGVATFKGDFIEFTPNDNFAGTAVVTYEISDGDKFSTATVEIEIAIPDAFNGLADQRSLSNGNDNDDAFGDKDGKLDGEVPVNLVEGEYSIQIGNDSKNSSGLSSEESEMTDGEYTVLSLNEQPFNLHDTATEPTSTEQLKSEIQNLVSLL